MGASGWSYFVPYEVDIETALQKLRQAVFCNGDYYQIEPYWQTMSFQNFLPPDPNFTAADIEAYRTEFEQRQRRPQPTSIETLLIWNGEAGTHSILDILNVSAVSQYGTVAPLKPQELRQFFGTDQPTRSQIELQQWAFDRYLQQTLDRLRGMGTYVVVYDGEAPSEIYSNP